MPTLTLIKGDSGYIIEFQVKDADGNIVDIEGCSVLFNIQKYGSSTLLFSLPGTVTNGTLGYCQFEVGTSLANASGAYSAEIQIEWGSGKILTVPNLSVKVLKDLPR